MVTQDNHCVLRYGYRWPDDQAQTIATVADDNPNNE